MNTPNDNSFSGIEAKPFRLLYFVQSYYKKVLALGAVLSILFSPIAWYMNSTHYVAQGVLQIAPTTTTFLYNGDERSIAGYYGTYVGTQVQRLSQVQTLMAAINRLPERIRAEFVGDGESLLNAAVRLKSTIRVNSVPRTHFIAIELVGSRPEGLAEMINSIINVYLEKVDEEVEGKDNRRLTFLRQEKNRLDKKIVQFQGKLEVMAKEAKVSTFLRPINLKNLQLEQVTGAYLSAQHNKFQSKHAYLYSISEAEAIKKLPINHLVERRAETHPLLAPSRTYTFASVRDITAALRGTKHEHPSFSLLTKREEHLEADLASLEDEVYQEVEDLIEESRDAGLEERIIKAENVYEAQKKIEEDLYNEMTRLESEVEKEAELIRQGQEVEKELMRIKELRTQVDQRIYALSVEAQAPGRISLESIARSVQKNNLKKLMSMAFMAAFGLALGLFFLVERRDKVIRLREDVESAIGATPSWPIEDYRVNGDSNIAFSQVTIGDPGSNSAKAIRSLAVKLNRERENQGAKVFAFTGTNRRAGASTICLNTAHSFRQICERVLIVDMNRQNPSIYFLTHNMFFEKGVNDVVKDGISYEECIVHDSKRDIDMLLMKPGTLPVDLDRGKFLKFINEMKNRYDAILIDTAPILESDLSEYMIVNSDVVVPVIQGNRSLYPDVYRLTKMLVRFEVRVIAPVLNWTELERTKKTTKRGWMFPLPRFVRKKLIRRKVLQRESERRNRYRSRFEREE